ncbi:MAG: hypothetical protein BWZ10_03145 [candidate division BRC1 bacterium ADurb.BinA364]|nr:MAG: hypothetical protein BWZ10_03145 [candidate division BRC1 bacterium ADurb.BinA364]
MGADQTGQPFGLQDAQRRAKFAFAAIFAMQKAIEYFAMRRGQRIVADQAFAAFERGGARGDGRLDGARFAINQDRHIGAADLHIIEPLDSACLMHGIGGPDQRGLPSRFHKSHRLIGHHSALPKK